ncbi:AAA family ATPase [Acinetobacter sp. UBA6720]|uniref:AAA family ATPase n=2 Tax=Acinetobacter TaxID=469 RepID=UPI0025BD6CAF|nr:AAA family ATPase [Acinetobacter sp. UBA6720]
MSVTIKELEIKNFRSCKDTKVLMKNFTALIGYNNAGKSNIILAIKFLLEGLSAKTFNYYTNANNHDDPIIVTATLINIKEELLNLLEDDHATKLRPFIINEELKIRRSTFIENNSKQKIVVTLFNGNEWKPIQSGIEQSIIKIFPKFIHIEAMSDAQEDSTKNKSGTAISKLLDLISLEIQENYQEQFTSSLAKVSELLSHNGEQRIDALSTVDAGINHILHNFFPDISVKLHFPTPTIEDIFKNGTIKIFENETIERDFSNFGHGSQRSIQMALIRYLADIQQNNPNLRRSNTIICIDEPELYLHPTTIELVRDALIILGNFGYQIIFPTHSASLLSANHAVNAIQIYKDSELGTQARQPISHIINQIAQNRFAQLNDAFKLNNASHIFFSDEVLLVEGKTELRVLPNIYSKITDRPFHLRKIALIAVEGKHNLIPMQKVIQALGIPVRIIADLDFIGNCAFWELIDENNAKDFEDFRKFVQKYKDHSDLQIDTEHTINCDTLRQIKAKKFNSIASFPEAKPIIENIHKSLKAKDIYIWKKGDIESIYGFNSKKEQEWKLFNSALINNEIPLESLIHDFEHLLDAIHWIN